MGLTTLEVEVGNPANPRVTEKVEFLIDSGAIYSVVPTPILERLGIKQLSTQEFRLADGSKIVRKKGIALFKYGDKIGGADVVFGEEGKNIGWGQPLKMDKTECRKKGQRETGPFSKRANAS